MTIQKTESWSVFGQLFTDLQQATDFENSVFKEYLYSMCLTKFEDCSAELPEGDPDRADYETILKRMMHYHHKLGQIQINKNGTVKVKL